MRAGRQKKNGSYSDDTVHGLVKARLKKMLSDSIRLEKKFGRDVRKKRKQTQILNPDSDSNSEEQQE